MSENRNTQKDYDQQITMSTKNLMALKEERKRGCNHKPSSHAQVMGIRDSKANIPNKKDLPDSTVVCTKCGKYFESSSYTPDEIDSGIYMLSSIIEQVKLNASLDADDLEMIDSCYTALDNLSGLATYYNNMVEKLANGGGKKNKQSRNNKGHMGVNSSMFGGRSY